MAVRTITVKILMFDMAPSGAPASPQIRAAVSDNPRMVRKFHQQALQPPSRVPGLLSKLFSESQNRNDTVLKSDLK